LASTLRHPSKLTIQFFEKNGLSHGDFQPVPGNVSKDVAVSSLSWNVESTILLVFAHDDSKDFVQLWTCGNYKWKLKKVWSFEKQEVVDAVWDPENPLR